MSIVEILILSVALSMDAFAVTVSNLIAHPTLSGARRMALPLFFGLFQGLMPLIGFFIGSLAATVINTYAGPLALVILAAIGGKMIYESLKEMREKRQRQQTSHTATGTAKDVQKTLSLSATLLQALATSIDALVVGVSFVALGVDILVAAPLITATTFLLCLVGLAIGRRVGLLLGERAQLIGGVVLILIGIKVCFF